MRALHLKNFAVAVWRQTRCDVAQDSIAAHSCAPKAEGVTKLPAPLNRFAQVFCTTRGLVITGHDGWLWVQPENQTLVVIPSTNVEAKAEPAAITRAGEDLELYFFDYFTYGWGISCPGGQCDLSSRFVILNMNYEPQKLPAPI
jgi:hypothetical protein